MCSLHWFKKFIKFFRLFPAFRTNAIWLIIKIFYLWKYEKPSCHLMCGQKQQNKEFVNKLTRNQKWSAKISAIFSSLPRLLKIRIISLCELTHKIHWSCTKHMMNRVSLLVLSGIILFPSSFASESEKNSSMVSNLFSSILISFFLFINYQQQERSVIVTVTWQRIHQCVNSIHKQISIS